MMWITLEIPPEENWIAAIASKRTNAITTQTMKNLSKHPDWHSSDVRHCCPIPCPQIRKQTVSPYTHQIAPPMDHSSSSFLDQPPNDMRQSLKRILSEIRPELNRLPIPSIPEKLLRVPLHMTSVEEGAPNRIAHSCIQTSASNAVKPIVSHHQQSTTAHGKSTKKNESTHPATTSLPSSSQPHAHKPTTDPRASKAHTTP